MRIKALLVSLSFLLVTTSPAAAAPIYAFPVAGCTVTYSVSTTMIIQLVIFLLKKVVHLLHQVAGVVDEVNTVDKWSGKTNTVAEIVAGLSISIIGDDGLRYYGSHLI